MSRLGNNFPLHIYIATLFVVLILLVGVTLGLFNLQRNEEMLLSASRQLFQRIGDEVATRFQQARRTSVTLVELLALSRLPQADDRQARMASLPMLHGALSQQPALAALQIGYEDGDFFILRPLHDATLRARFQAPAQAHYVVDEISDGPQGRRLARFYFDARLQPVGRQPPKPARYDPRQRPWYRQAKDLGGTILSRPYLYYFIRRIGVTVARMDPNARAVVAADITLDSLSDILRRHPLPPSTELLILDDEGRVIANRRPGRAQAAEGAHRIPRLDDLDSPVVRALAPRLLQEPGQFRFRFDDRPWRGAIRQLTDEANLGLTLVMLAPDEELLQEAHGIARTTALITGIIILLSLPLAWLFARSISRPLRKLAEETQQIQLLDFHNPVTTSSRIYEIKRLAQGMDAMKRTINKFLRLITSLAEEQDFHQLLHRITAETLETSGVDGAGVMLVDDACQALENALWQSPLEGWHPHLPPIELGDQDHPFIDALTTGEVKVLTLNRSHAGPLAPLFRGAGRNQLQLALFPLRDRRGEPMGLLYLVSRRTPRRHPREQLNRWLSFVRSLTDFAAVSLETRMLLRSQKALLESFMEVIAGAIDAKSPYTGGHCQRVPELARLLSDAAAHSKAPPFQDYAPDAGEREALEIAAWLHDCGKVTTPEHVVDKATRLECLYDRIHEIRMRFEVLKRDAWIDYWRALAEGGDADTLAHKRDAELRALDDDFAFVARCNRGEEIITPAHRERLARIAKRRWRRTLNDRLGLSWTELKRKARTPASKLPVEEPLLADRPDHLVPRRPEERIPPDNPWGFRMAMPENRLNLGELHNLTVSEGTLTEEERYIVNEHIIQTILMLEQLPYPRHLRQVPVLAGSHHERVDGTGYPRGLKGDQLPLGARIMAIADIFEALTASDRPYKKAKTLSEAIHILWELSREGHIDADLFELFLRSGIHLQYAQKYLPPEQIDEVEIGPYLGTG